MRTMKNNNRMQLFQPRLRATAGLALVAAALALILPRRAAAEEKAAVPKIAASSPANTNRPYAAPKILSGAELYSMHCNRCHPERYPTERTAAQWKTILLHMRVRANLPAQQARTILRYLQDNSGR